MRLLPGLHEPKSPVASSEGIRVVIHPPDTEPFPFAEGFDVPPGFSVSFGIRPRKNLRIKAPYGKFVRESFFKDLLIEFLKYFY